METLLALLAKGDEKTLLQIRKRYDKQYASKIEIELLDKQNHAFLESLFQSLLLTQNNSWYQFQLGHLYHKVPWLNDVQKAKELYEASALQNNAHAQHYLGVLCENDDFGSDDFTEALKWHHLG